MNCQIQFMEMHIFLTFFAKNMEFFHKTFYNERYVVLHDQQQCKQEKVKISA